MILHWPARIVRGLPSSRMTDIHLASSHPLTRDKRRVSDIDNIRLTQAARTFGSSWMA
jgi:hypothetical protein